MRRRWNKIMALLLASAVLTANVGVVSTFAAGDEKTQQAAQNDESKEETDSEDKKQDDEKTTQTAAPTATVKEGTYSETQKITLKSSAKDAVIYYTTDGKEPTEKSTRFDAKKPIEVKKTTTIKAIAVSKETGKSKIATFTYKIGESDKKEESKETPAAEQTPSATPTTAPTEIPKQAQTSSEQGEAQLMP
ncbi:MAG: chitobiase/beta-hexosaminidase C-terminal domain-containing protein, partial [Lachnospiraceae bacterium]|nr:chitobiase/beta-hexosaminidase C-terminal domain-containing protein [Lachnospiraceae bacterium]